MDVQILHVEQDRIRIGARGGIFLENGRSAGHAITGSCFRVRSEETRSAKRSPCTLTW